MPKPSTTYTEKQNLFRLFRQVIDNGYIDSPDICEKIKQCIHQVDHLYLNETDEENHTPIQVAIKHKLYNIAILLAKYKYRKHYVDLTVLDKDGNTLLHLAAETGNLAMITTLLEVNNTRKSGEKISSDKCNAYAKTFLDVAYINEFEDIVMHFLDNYPALKEQQIISKLETIILHYAAQYSYHALSEAIIKHNPKLLLQRKFDGRTVLHEAVLSGGVELVEFLLKQDKDSTLLWLPDNQGNTVAMEAVLMRHTHLVETLWHQDQALFDKSNDHGKGILYSAMKMPDTKARKHDHQFIQDHNTTLQFIINLFKERTTEEKNEWVNEYERNDLDNLLECAIRSNNIEGIKLVLNDLNWIAKPYILDQAKASALSALDYYMNDYRNAPRINSAKAIFKWLLRQGSNFDIPNLDSMIKYWECYARLKHTDLLTKRTKDKIDLAKNQECRYLLNGRLYILAMLYGCAHGLELDQHNAFDSNQLQRDLEHMKNRINHISPPPKSQSPTE